MLFVSQFVGENFPFKVAVERLGYRINKAEQSAIFPYLNASFKKRMYNAKSNKEFENEFVLATIETIVRHCRKTGWNVKHTSANLNNRRATSRYIKIPNSGICRLSNHPLWTPNKYWNGDVIVHYADCFTNSLGDWITEVEKKADFGSYL